jgi:hypothetical protein
LTATTELSVSYITRETTGYPGMTGRDGLIGLLNVRLEEPKRLVETPRRLGEDVGGVGVASSAASIALRIALETLP